MRRGRDVAPSEMKENGQNLEITAPPKMQNNLKHHLDTTDKFFRACLARFKLVPVEEDGRKRKKKRMEGEREKEKRQEEEKGGSRQ